MPDRTYTSDQIDALLAGISAGGIASIDGVSNPDGDVDLVAGSNITITPDNSGKTITIAAAGTSPPFSDNAALVKNNTDDTKLVRLDAASVATGTTRVITMPNSNVNLTADQAAGTGSPRTLGTGAQQALPGTHEGSGGTAHANATTSTAGFESAADKSKLDGIGQLTRVERSTAFSHGTSSGWVLIDWNVEVTDDGSWYNNATSASRIVVNAAGNYTVQATCAWASNSTGIRSVRILKNGVALGEAPIVSAPVDQYGRGVIAFVASAVATDYFTVEAFQSSGGALNFSNAGTTPNPFFSVIREK